ncbi:MAG: BrxA/BrxB family bacilliredoxin [Gemmatimonadetes bacterium]|nr:BrxA/BrxB family bacilliredoxin [Gemmatimonadota bacterium]MBI2401311.1 BrxA/BrxB family bacilliredoxin [Gemmatimonadota bacterium]MBI2615793.1 BrxA/BrxB family bacilliredoxin [Gemmatimonadota bacterium]
MRYDPRLVQPMREELTRLGFLELKTPDQVDAAVREGTGTLLLVVNSVCGCAAGRARPGVALALTHRQRPDRLATVFAGMELEATDRARSYFAPYPPSSPQIGLFKAGRLVFMLERKDIERRPPEEIARDLVGAFDTHCA